MTFVNPEPDAKVSPVASIELLCIDGRNNTYREAITAPSGGDCG